MSTMTIREGQTELYRDPDRERVFPSRTNKPPRAEKQRYRTEYRRDYDRILHSPAFRRLQGKTQLFPGIESDFFRNRLTHSLEVAQIASSIAIMLNSKEQIFKGRKNAIDIDIVRAASLAHDLGHPPFGHNGELALDECMRPCGGFEGNAQTLRILIRLAKRQKGHISPHGVSDGTDHREGLNLTCRTLASVLKYDVEIPFDRRHASKIEKGYYGTEASIVRKMRETVAGEKLKPKEFKTVECHIMDMADDIAYSTFDLEDAFHGGFLTPLDMLAADVDTCNEVAKRVTEDLERPFTGKAVYDHIVDLFEGFFSLEESELPKRMKVDIRNPRTIIPIYARAYNSSRDLAVNGYRRTEFTSGLIAEFILGVYAERHPRYKHVPALSVVKLRPEIEERVAVLKHFVFEKITSSARLKVTEYRGKQIVKEIFEAIDERNGYRLMPDDYRAMYCSFQERDVEGRKRTISDFISGMTDRYAVEFYGRLASENPQTIFKP